MSQSKPGCVVQGGWIFKIRNGPALTRLVFDTYEERIPTTTTGTEEQNDLTTVHPPQPWLRENQKMLRPGTEVNSSDRRCDI